MLGTDFVKLFTHEKLLREYICRMARVHSSNSTIQEDLIQEAWIRLSQCDADCDMGYYYTEAYRAIHACYCREWWKWGRRSEAAKEKKRIRDRTRYYLKKISQKV